MVPYARVTDGSPHSNGSAVVDHRIDEHLEHRFHCRIDRLAVAREQCQPRRESAAGATPPDGDPSCVDAQCHGIGIHPLQRRIAVFHRSRCLVLWRQPVVDRDSDASHFTHDMTHRVVFGLWRSNDVSTTMHVAQSGQILRASSGPENPHAHLWRTLRPRDHSIFDHYTAGIGHARIFRHQIGKCLSCSRRVGKIRQGGKLCQRRAKFRV